MRFSKRALELAESATMRVTRKAAELRAAGREILSFGAGEPDFDSPTVVRDAAKAGLDAGHTRYTPAAGIPALREAVAARFAARDDAPWTGADAMVTVGAKAGLFQLMMALLDEGDEIVIPRPAWVSFEAQARFAGASVRWVDTSWRDRFAVHADAVIEALGPKTRVLLLNAPSNPTGGVITAADLERVVDACVERDIVVISDETYDRFVYDGTHTSVAALARRYPDHVVLVGSFSKTYAMTGWRLGYLLGPQPLIAKLGALQGHMTSNPTTFAMDGGVAALADAEADVARMIEAFARRRDLIVDRLQAIDGVRCTAPVGAFYVFPDVARLFGPGRENSVALAEFLLEEAGVAVVPGVAFGADDHIRLSFATDEETIEQGLARIADALSA